MTINTSFIVMGHEVTPFSTSGDYDLALGVTPGGMPGPPPHTHQTYNEVFLITEGEMEFVLDGKARKVAAGEIVDIPSGCLHTFANRENAPCKWINIHSPKGFRAFFETFGVLASEEDALEQSLSPGLIEGVLERAGEFDMQIKIPEGAGPA